MLFNSLQFACFFVIVYTLYLFLNHKWQNRMLLVASYIFYGAWDWRFLSLIYISTLLDYFCGIKIHQSDNHKKRKAFLLFSIIGNLTLLGFFKYYDFFTDNLQLLLSHFGIAIQPHFLHIILPVGISFYTFQTMSYTIDIYRREMEPTKKFLDFALFVAYFPQLVAGPIERASHLLPQVLNPRKLSLDKFFEGFYLIFWGLFQKVFIADNLAKIVEPAFTRGISVNGAEVILAAYAFAFQIFCDFAGYSNIARGLGKCMGFDIMVNFNLPYFSTNPREFWHRWHISFSTWLKDYLYIPLGGSRKGRPRTLINLALTMFLGGLWHGAAWTFIFWGIYHAILLILHRIIEPFLKGVLEFKNAFLATMWLIIRIIFFFNLVCISWLIFRAESMGQFYNMFKSVLFYFRITPDIVTMFNDILYLIFFLLAIQVIQYFKKDLFIVLRWPRWGKAVFFIAIICLYIHNLIYGKYSWIENRDAFIYFQF